MIVLVLGGTRSGKSEVAERLAAGFGERCTFVATAVITDPQLAARVEAHRARRPATWSTIECGPDLPEVIAGIDGPVLVDSLGTWVAHAPGMAVDAAALATALGRRRAPTVLVSEEVGLAVHPTTESGRRFTDALGDVNRGVAAVADRVLLVVAGRALDLAPVDRLPGAG
ncbi:MAG TPA: bifunctional adenosylcobinamide kinase/adenosylcobinamide-phosphate guanylyltransferase [Acidimicrobiia bacterium]